MAAASVDDQRVVEKGDGPFDLLLRLGAVMGGLTALLTALQSVLDLLNRQEIAALLPALIGLGIIVALVAAISGLTWLARRSRSMLVGFLATICLAMVTTVLGMAMAAAALPRFGYQLALQRVTPPSVPDAIEGGSAPIEIGLEGVDVSAPPAAPSMPEPSRSEPAPTTSGPGLAPVDPSASAEGGTMRTLAADPFEACVQRAQTEHSTYEAQEEAMAQCLAS